MSTKTLGTSLTLRASATVLLGLALVVLASVPASAYTPPPDPRQVVSLDNGWRFNLGNVAGAEASPRPER